jgi:hypothetical protein
MSLLDAADHTPDLAKKYETIQKRFSARLPIMQMVMRRQKIEYKLKMIQKIASSDQPPQGNEEMSREEAVAAKPVLLTELNELRNSIEVMIRDYEGLYGERFERARAGNQDMQQQQGGGHSRSQLPPSPPKHRTPLSSSAQQQQMQQQQMQQQVKSFSGQRSPVQQQQQQAPRRTPPPHKAQSHSKSPQPLPSRY